MGTPTSAEIFYNKKVRVRVESWKGLLSVTVTDVSTTWAEVIIRVKWRVVCQSKNFNNFINNYLCCKSGSWKLIGEFAVMLPVPFPAVQSTLSYKLNYQSICWARYDFINHIMINDFVIRLWSSFALYCFPTLSIVQWHSHTSFLLKKKKKIVHNHTSCLTHLAEDNVPELLELRDDVGRDIPGPWGRRHW